MNGASFVCDPSIIAESYFQFPISVFAYGRDLQSRLAGILSYCAVDFALRSQLCDSPNEEAAEIGARELGFSFGNPAAATALYVGFQEHQKGFERSPMVRLPVSLVFEVWENRGMTYDEFAVLSAVRSIIGRRKFPIVIRRQGICYRMMGYTRAPAREELERREDGCSLWPAWKAGRMLEVLHQRRLFARVTLNRRQTYYALRMTDEQLLEKLVENEARKAGLLQLRKDAEQRLKALRGRSPRIA